MLKTINLNIIIKNMIFNFKTGKYKAVRYVKRIRYKNNNITFNNSNNNLYIVKII